MIVICSATIIPIEAIIGNNNEFSWDDASLIYSTDVEMVPVLSSILLLAFSKVLSNPAISDFKTSSSLDVSSKIEFSLIIWSEIPPKSWLRTVVAEEPWDVVPWLKDTTWKTCVPSPLGIKSTKNNPWCNVLNEADKGKESPEGKWTWVVPNNSVGLFPIKRPSLVVCTNTRNDWLIAAVSGAKTRVFTCLSTGTSTNSVVDENFTSIFLDMPFCAVLITSTVYVP